MAVMRDVERVSLRSQLIKTHFKYLAKSLATNETFFCRAHSSQGAPGNKAARDEQRAAC